MSAAAQERIEFCRREQFAHLRRHGVRPSSVDALEHFLRSDGALEAPSLIVRCRFGDGAADCRIVVDKPKSHWRLSTQLMPFLHRIQHRVRGHADVLILVSDTLYVTESRKAECVRLMQQAPFLRCDWLGSDPVSSHALIIPDFMLMSEQYAVDMEAIRMAAEQTPFAERQELIKWRGRLSGPGFPGTDNCHLFARYHLLKLSAAHPQVLDARLTYTDNFADSPAGEALRKEVHETLGGTVAELAPAAFAACKYLIAIDGVISAWKRVPDLLRTGSVLLLPVRWRQYFYPGLVAWEHYVPVAHDLSDLLEIYHWLREHPQEAERIGREGQRFVESMLSVAAIEDQFVSVIDTCAELLRANSGAHAMAEG